MSERCSSTSASLRWVTRGRSSTLYSSVVVDVVVRRRRCCPPCRSVETKSISTLSSTAVAARRPDLCLYSDDTDNVHLSHWGYYCVTFTHRILLTYKKENLKTCKLIFSNTVLLYRAIFEINFRSSRPPQQQSINRQKMASAKLNSTPSNTVRLFKTGRVAMIFVFRWDLTSS